MNLTELAKLTGGELVGAEAAEVKTACSLENQKEDGIVYIADVKRFDINNVTAAAAFLPKKSKEDIEKNLTKNLNVIYVDNPEWAFTQFLRHLSAARDIHPSGIHPTAVIDPSVKLGAGVSVGAYSVIEPGSDIGDNSVIYPHVFIGRNVKIGQNALVYPQVVIREDTVIGKNFIAEAGARIGVDGFGFVMVNGKHEKIPQVGNVVIGDDVEIGANTAVDRAKIDVTAIESNVKLDNLIQIAHNVKIGYGSVLVSQVGVAGSTELGKYVVLGGQVGVAGHIKLGDQVQVGAQSGIMGNIEKGRAIFGTPARDIKEMMKIYAIMGKLPELYKEIRDFKKVLKAKKPWWKFW